jgi:hypothetical protein
MMDFPDFAELSWPLYIRSAGRFRKFAMSRHKRRVRKITYNRMTENSCVQPFEIIVLVLEKIGSDKPVQITVEIWEYCEL